MRLRTMLVSATATALLAGSAAAWHNHLTKSIPAKDEQVAASPASVRLWFAEKPVPAFTSITLLKADSSKVAIGKARPTEDSLSVAADVSEPLPAGKYTVSWRTAGDDGHAIRGKFSFSVSQ